MSVNFPQSSQNDETCKNKNINEIDSNYSNNNNNITEPKSSNDNNNNNAFNSNNLLDNDDESNLKFHSKLLLQLENTPQQYKNQPDYKYSIDLQNNDKKIHEYLNNDLINELDKNFSPNIIYNENNYNNNTNNNNIINIKGKKIFNENEIPKLELNNNNINNNNNNNNNNINNNNNNFIIENNYNNNNQININYHNKFDFINNNIIINNKLNNYEKNSNNFIFMNLANNQKTKPKKTFERREGDWICFNCNNLNFSFRKICNRCGITKEMSIKNSNLNNKDKNTSNEKNEEKSEVKKDNNNDNKKEN